MISGYFQLLGPWRIFSASQRPIVHHLEGLLHRGPHAHVAQVQRIAVLRELRNDVHLEGLRGHSDLPGNVPFPQQFSWAIFLGIVSMVVPRNYHGFTMLMMVF